jgi:hypothetical protein
MGLDLNELARNQRLTSEVMVAAAIAGNLAFGVALIGSVAAVISPQLATRWSTRRTHLPSSTWPDSTN